MIARRAYELCETREDGHTLEDWLRAEPEVLCPVGFIQSNRCIDVCAAVQGFAANDPEVSVEPFRLWTSGRKTTSERDADAKFGGTLGPLQIFRDHDLPVEVNPSEATDTLEHGILHLVFPRAKRSETLHVESRVL